MMTFDAWFQQRFGGVGFDAHTPIKEYIRQGWEAGQENAPVDDGSNVLEDEIHDLKRELEDARQEVEELQRDRQQDRKLFEERKSLIH